MRVDTLHFYIKVGGDWSCIKLKCDAELNAEVLDLCVRGVSTILHLPI